MTKTITSPVKKIDFINMTKGFAIILVVLGHCVKAEGLSANIIFSFHMPLFFIIGGYLFNYQKYEHDYKIFVKNKAKRLLIPYFFCCFLFFLHWLTFECPNPVINTPLTHIFNLFMKTTAGILYGIGNVNVFPPLKDVFSIGPLWFLVTYFLGINLLYFFIKYFEKKNIYIRIIALLLLTYSGAYIGKFIFLPWGLDIALVCLSFLYAGYVIKKHNIISYICDKNFAIILFILFLGYLFAFNNSRISLNDRDYHHLLIAVAGAIITSTIIMCLFKIWADNENKTIGLKNALSYLGIESIIILCFHGRLQYLLPNTSWLKYSPIIESVYLILYCLAIGVVLNKIPYINKIFSSNKYKQSGI